MPRAQRYAALDQAARQLVEAQKTLLDTRQLLEAQQRQLAACEDAICALYAVPATPSGSAMVLQLPGSPAGRTS